MRLMAVLAVVVALVGSRGVWGQEATPKAWVFEERSLDRVSRVWDESGNSSTPDRITSILAIAYSFESEEVASEALADLPGWWFSDRFGPGVRSINVERMTAPTVGEESVLYGGDRRLGQSPDGIVDVALFFRTGSCLVILRASSAVYLLAEIDDVRMGETILEIGMKIEGRTPSGELPYNDGSITRGGLFDLLPGYDDMPEGFTLAEESPVVAADTSATPSAS